MRLSFIGLDRSDPEQPRNNGLVFRAATDRDGCAVLEGVPEGVYGLSGASPEAALLVEEELAVHATRFERTLHAVRSRR